MKRRSQAKAGRSRWKEKIDRKRRIKQQIEVFLPTRVLRSSKQGRIYHPGTRVLRSSKPRLDADDASSCSSSKLKQEIQPRCVGTSRFSTDPNSSGRTGRAQLQGDPTGCVCSNWHIAGKSSSHTGGASSPLRIAGVRSPRTRSLPGRLSDVEHLLVMAPPRWPDSLLEHFVIGCVEQVHNGFSVPAMADLFYKNVADYMSSKSALLVQEKDVATLFKYYRKLWGDYHKDLQSWTISCHLQSKNLKNKDPMMKNLNTKEPDSKKYEIVVRHLNDFNDIFKECQAQKSTQVRACMYNTGSNGDVSATSNRKRSIDEPLSRQLRQKSSDIDKPESSANGMTLGIALDELSHGDNALAYAIASKCLQDPIMLHAYSLLPTIDKKVEYLQLAWRLEYDPKSVVACLPPPS